MEHKEEKRVGDEYSPGWIIGRIYDHKNHFDYDLVHKETGRTGVAREMKNNIELVSFEVKEEDWEKEFDKKFTNKILIDWRRYDIKDFISSLLKENTQRVLEESANRLTEWLMEQPEHRINHYINKIEAEKILGIIIKE